MVVNSETAYLLHVVANGRHWFTVAWIIEPETQS